MIRMFRVKLVNSLYKKIYNKTNKLTGRLYRDESWEGVDLIENTISDCMKEVGYDGKLLIYPVEGGYRTSKDGLAQWKEYEVEINSADGVKEIYGKLNCHAAGSVNDPFDRYDMSLVISKA